MKQKETYGFITDLNRFLKKRGYIRRHGKVVKKMRDDFVKGHPEVKVIFEDAYYATFKKSFGGGWYKHTSNSIDVIGWLDDFNIKRLGLKGKITKTKRRR